jgi:hypothetical protein
MLELGNESQSESSEDTFWYRTNQTMENMFRYMAQQMRDIQYVPVDNACFS